MRRFEASPDERRKILPPGVVLPELRRQTSTRSGDLHLRRLLHGLLGEAPPGVSWIERYAPELLYSRVAAALETGWLLAVETRVFTAQGSRNGPVETRAPEEPSPEPVAPPEALTWIEIILLDEEGKALSGETLKVTLTDGSTQEVKLDGRGAFRADQIPQGTCTASFPQIKVLRSGTS